MYASSSRSSRRVPSGARSSRYWAAPQWPSCVARSKALILWQTTSAAFDGLPPARWSKMDPRVFSSRVERTPTFGPNVGSRIVRRELSATTGVLLLLSAFGPTAPLAVPSCILSNKRDASLPGCLRAYFTSLCWLPFAGAAEPFWKSDSDSEELSSLKATEAPPPNGPLSFSLAASPVLAAFLARKMPSLSSSLSSLLLARSELLRAFFLSFFFSRSLDGERSRDFLRRDLDLSRLRPRLLSLSSPDRSGSPARAFLFFLLWDTGPSVPWWRRFFLFLSSLSFWASFSAFFSWALRSAIFAFIPLSSDWDDDRLSSSSSSPSPSSAQVAAAVVAGVFLSPGDLGGPPPASTNLCVLLIHSSLSRPCQRAHGTLRAVGGSRS